MEFADEIKTKINEEHDTLASISRESLAKLGLSLGEIHPECRKNLQKLARFQEVSQVQSLDTVSVCTWYTDREIFRMKSERVSLELKQLLSKTKSKSKRDSDAVEEFKLDLEHAKGLMAKEEYCPETISKMIMVHEEKLVRYRQTLTESQDKFSRLNVKGELRSKSLEQLMDQLTTLRKEASELKDKANNITLARKAKADLLKLKGMRI